MICKFVNPAQLFGVGSFLRGIGITLLLIAALFPVGRVSGSTTNEIIVSPIGEQEVIAGGRIDIFFMAFDPNPSGVTFSSTDLPAFCEIINNGDNSGRIAVNTTVDQAGDYLFHLQVSGTAGTSVVPVQLKVLAIAPTATVYYCDPLTGNINNTGDAAHPWSTLEDVFSNNKTFENGDVIFLRTGFHGSPQVLGQNEGKVYIAAQANHTPGVRKMSFVFAKNWVVSGVDISPETAGVTATGTYVRMVANAKYNVIENCRIYAIENSTAWTTNQAWYDNCGDGILNKGEHNTIRNSKITNTYFSVTVDGEHNHFDYNIIDRFGGDAIRGIASYNTFNHNVVMNAVVSDYENGNHDDAFQSWTFGAPIKSIQIKGNIVFSCTDPDLPLKTEILQGIVIFDGYAEDWVVENNLVVIDHPHGIALYGAKNCKVVNNTVIRNPLELFYYGSHPWIRVNKHKNGGFSTGNLVRNNLSGALSLESVPGTDDHNTVSTSYNTYLEDYDAWNFHLNSASPAIDAGYSDDTPGVDMEGYVRLSTDTPDRGCLEKGSDIWDREAPSTPENLQMTDLAATGGTLTWDASTDNVSVNQYLIRYGERWIRTTATSVAVKDLAEEHDYSFEVVAIDLSGNVSLPATIAVTTPAIPAGDSLYTIRIYAHHDDQQIRSYQKLEWVGLYDHRIGGIQSDYNTAAVIPFRLPVLGEGEEIKYATLEMNYEGVHNFPDGSVDLYGLPYRVKSDVLATDHWQGTFGGDGNSTALIAHFISPFSPQGIITSGQSAAVDIATYINEQYVQGASGGNYVFFRLNSDVTETAGNYYTVSSADAPDAFDRPVLELTIRKEVTGIAHLPGQVSGVAVYPNPISTGQVLYVDIPEYHLQDTQLSVHDMLGRLVFETSIESGVRHYELNLEKSAFTKGIYQLSLTGSGLTGQARFIVK